MFLQYDKMCVWPRFMFVLDSTHLLCPQQCGSDAYWLTCHFDAAPARTYFLQGIKKIATFLNEFGALLLTRRLHSAAVPPRFLATTRPLVHVNRDLIEKAQLTVSLSHATSLHPPTLPPSTPLESTHACVRAQTYQPASSWPSSMRR
jgi:hypothetical protein